MPNRLASSTAQQIVRNDTATLISEADTVTSSCTGLNCNVSPANRAAVTSKLSQVAQQQAADTIYLLSVPTTSILARNIFDGYLQLAAAVSGSYNYQCGNLVDSKCTAAASPVHDAQFALEIILTDPAANELSHLTVLSVIAAMMAIFAILFFVFVLIGVAQRTTVIVE
jgi:hypothetical protein